MDRKGLLKAGQQWNGKVTIFKIACVLQSEPPGDKRRVLMAEFEYGGFKYDFFWQ